MGIRARKQHLITVLRFKKLAYKMTEEQFSGFELMYRRAKTEPEQDQVTAVIEGFLNGWKTEHDTYSRLLRDVNDFGDNLPFGEDEEDSPAMKAALAQSRVTFRR